MHELSLMQGVLDTLKDSALQHGITRIKTVKLVIGKMTMVLPNSLAFAFEVLKQEELLADASLVIEEREAVCRCDQCNRESVLENFHKFCCPLCGSSRIKVSGGDELQIDYFEGD